MIHEFIVVCNYHSGPSLISFVCLFVACISLNTLLRRIAESKVNR